MPRGGEDFRQPVALAASHQHAPRSAKLSEGRRGAQTSRASWAGNPGVWTDEEDSQALGLLSPGDPGHPAGNHCGKEASARPCHGPGLISRALTLPV